MSLKVNGEAFDEAMASIQKNEYMAVLFYASWCSFSSIFKPRFSTLSSMYPQIKHMMVEQSSAMPRWVFLIYVLSSCTFCSLESEFCLFPKLMLGTHTIQLHLIVECDSLGV